MAVSGAEPAGRSNGAARLVSALLAVAVAGGLTAYPYLFGRDMTARLHEILPFVLFGVCGGFVHAVGFVPDNRWVRALLSPIVAWPLMVGGTTLLLLAPG